MTRTVASYGVFVMTLLVMVLVSAWAWDTFVNGHLYFCTDGVGLEFINAGDWVHHPESVAHVVPRTMEQPDEILQGWSMTSLLCLWAAFVFVSILVSAAFAFAHWRALKPSHSGEKSRMPAAESGPPH